MKYIIYIVLLTLQITFIAANPTISAINYDPQGADGGYEWIELYNPYNETLVLNHSLVKGNGAKENDWTHIITLNATMQPYSYYLVGEEYIDADIITKLGLQNGPDAVKLTKNNQTIETIGWGTHEFSEYYQGEPTIDTTKQLLRIQNTTNKIFQINYCKIKKPHKNLFKKIHT